MGALWRIAYSERGAALIVSTSAVAHLGDLIAEPCVRSTTLQYLTVAALWTLASHESADVYDAFWNAEVCSLQPLRACELTNLCRPWRSRPTRSECR